MELSAFKNYWKTALAISSNFRALHHRYRLIFALPSFSVDDSVATSVAFSTDATKALCCVVTDAAIVLTRLAVFTSVADTIAVARTRHWGACTSTAGRLARPKAFLIWVAKPGLKGGGLAAKPNTIPFVGSIVERQKVVVLAFSIVERVWDDH